MVRKRSVSILLRILKFSGIILFSIFILFGIVSWIVVEKKNDWLLNQIQSYLEETQSGELKIAAINFKLFRSFPDISIELDGIDYFQQQDSIRLPDEQPILHAEQLFVALKLLPLIWDELIISEISISQAHLNIVEVEKGVLNLDLALAKPVLKRKAVPKKITPTPSVKPPATIKKSDPTKVTPKPDIQIDLQLIDLNDIQLIWKSFSNSSPSVVQINNVTAYLVKDKNLLTTKLTSTNSIQSLAIRKVQLPPGALSFDIEIQYEIDQQFLTIKKSEVKYEEFSAIVEGTYAHQKNQFIDVQIDASSNDLEFLSSFIKPEVISQNPDLLKQGDIYAAGRVFGELKEQAPQFDISFGVKNLDLQLPKNMGTFHNLDFKGNFTSGPQPDYSQAKFEIDNLNAQLPGGFLKGRFQLTNFIEPSVDYALNAKLKLDGYDEIFRIDFLKQLRGTITLEANFNGPLKMIDKHKMDSSRSSYITLDSISFVIAKTNQRVSKLSGKIETENNQTAIHQLTFAYGENDMVVDATVDNLIYFLIQEESEAAMTGHFQSRQLFTQDFIPDTLLTAQVQDRISNLSFDFKVNTTSNREIPESNLPNIRFDIRNLTCQLDKLANIKKVDAAGFLHETSNGLKLDLQEFEAIMPYGNVNVIGDLLIPEKKLMTFNAKVKATKFPWTYITELVNEINEDKEPILKNIPVKEMEIVTANIDLSASIITFPFDITKLDVRNSRINFSPSGSEPITVDNLTIDLENLYFNHPTTSGAIIGLKSTKGTIDMNQVSIAGLKKVDIHIQVDGQNDQLDFEFSSATQKAKSESGKLKMNIAGKEPLYDLHFSVQQANLQNYIKKFYKKKLMEGAINYNIDLQSTGLSWERIKQNLSGEIEITGDSLQLYGVNIDKVLRKYEKSQNFNLTDLGAVLVAGPIGLAVTKGTDFVSLAAISLDSSQQTKIKTLVTKWKVENQQLITKDVAFATTQNRVAFDGVIDFANDSIPGITIAVVDKQGCSLMDQRLHGKMNALKTGKLNITKTLFGSVINFVNAVVGKDCKPVYTGVVKDPLH